MRERAKDAENGFNRNSLRPAYMAIKRLSSVPVQGVCTFLKAVGTVEMGVGKVLRNTSRSCAMFLLPLRDWLMGSSVPWWLRSRPYGKTHPHARRQRGWFQN